MTPNKILILKVKARSQHASTLKQKNSAPLRQFSTFETIKSEEVEHKIVLVILNNSLCAK